MWFYWLVWELERNSRCLRAKSDEFGISHKASFPLCSGRTFRRIAPGLCRSSGVLGITGIETAEIVQGIVEHVKLA